MSRTHRQHCPQFKLETVLEGLQGEKTIAQICRECDIKEALCYKWRQAFLEQRPEIFADRRKPVDTSQDERIAELERMVGRLTIILWPDAARDPTSLSIRIKHQ